ncbi:MAG: hypothetical protein ABR980_00835 [Ignavibacteriaceae bacterium]|jgi:hypothetical protein
MNESKENTKKVFKYNMSFYYQSTIIYFIVFIFYVVIRGEFIENSYKLITKDPIIYSFVIIVSVSVVSLLYNLYINRYLEITEEKISFINRFAIKTFQFDQLLEIKISYPRQRSRNRAFRLIRIKLKYRRRPVIIRPYDYENEEELINKLTELNEKLGNN